MKKSISAFLVAVLLLDHVEPMKLPEILIPFISSYRPFRTGVGIIAFYLMKRATHTGRPKSIGTM